MSSDIAILIWSGIGKHNLIHPAKWLLQVQIISVAHPSTFELVISWQLIARAECASWASAWEQRGKSPWLLPSLGGGVFPTLEICLGGWLSLCIQCCLPSMYTFFWANNYTQFSFVNMLLFSTYTWGEADSPSQFQGLDFWPRLWWDVVSPCPKWLVQGWAVFLSWVEEGQHLDFGTTEERGCFLLWLESGSV